MIKSAREIYAHEHPIISNVASIFLAGPSPKGPKDFNWRIEAISYLQRKKYKGDIYIPLTRDGIWLPDYDAQIDWELTYLNKAKVIAFWIPRDLVNLPGFTTNIEFGMFLKSCKIILGYPKGASKMRYIHYVAEMNNVPVFNSLKKTLDKAIALAM